MGYLPSLGTFVSRDPLGTDAYESDGMNLTQFVRGNPVVLTDPTGLAATTQPATTQAADLVTATVTIDAGGKDPSKPWIGATWTTYFGVPGDKGNPGLVRISIPTVSPSSSSCNVHFDISVKIQIQLRNTKDKIVIGPGHTLTDAGRGVYGHEQLHVQDAASTLQQLVAGIADAIPDPIDAADAKRKADQGARDLRKAIKEWRDARQPGGKGPDITHGGPGQPVSGQPNDPQGEPGPYAAP
jgi:hypothetical protein